MQGDSSNGVLLDTQLKGQKGQLWDKLMAEYTIRGSTKCINQMRWMCDNKRLTQHLSYPTISCLFCLFVLLGEVPYLALTVLAVL